MPVAGSSALKGLLLNIVAEFYIVIVCPQGFFRFCRYIKVVAFGRILGIINEIFMRKGTIFGRYVV
ncbi:MAG: hypothetical protein LBU67_06055 [Oscillospiraceae bacterium]|jgi:hypothetical protein|nr:hypothetical protein [Oscillospiraceae bacterium]